MKLRIGYYALFLLLVTTAWAQHQHHHTTVQSGSQLDISDDSAAQLLTLRLGPLNLPAHTGHMAMPQPAAQFLEIPFEGWILAYHPSLVDSSGNRLPSRLLHHVAFWNTARPDFLCPNKEEHIFGAGGEMNDWPAVADVGYRVHRGQRIRVTSMFHNPTATSYVAYLKVKIDYRTATAGPALRSAYPAWFDVEECGNSSYDLAPDKNLTSGQFAVPYAGELVGVSGHMHDYAKRLVLSDVSSGRDIATLEAKVSPEGKMISMPLVMFPNPDGYPLLRGEVLKVTAIYENPTGNGVPEGAMGIVVGYFVPKDDGEMAGLEK